jgi:hypothetical protein
LPAFALTGRKPKRPYTQGVALGWVILVFQAVGQRPLVKAVTFNVLPDTNNTIQTNLYS